MIKVKICGITNLEDAQDCSDSGADALGFIFSRKSPRYLSPQAAGKIISKLDPFLVKVGVFLDEKKETVYDTAVKLNLDVLQFHGQETAAYCRSFKPRFKVIKVFFPEDRPYLKKVASYKADGFMFDIKYQQKIKGSRELPLEALKEIKKLISLGKRVIISGGLNLNNVTKIKKIKPYALDLSSGLERLVGKKDQTLVKAFIKKVKQ